MKTFSTQKVNCYFMKDCLISGCFDTKYMTVLRIEHILRNFEDQKFANFVNLEQVNFCVTLVIYLLKMKMPAFKGDMKLFQTYQDLGTDQLRILLGIYPENFIQLRIQ